MLRERLDRGDFRLVAVAAVLIAASALYVRSNYFAAFPEASINLKLSKDEITARADAFLRAQGLKTDGFRNLTLFDPDDDARLFLEREMGLNEANRLMTGPVAVWRWRARWFRPPEKEEMRVWLSPEGRLIGFEHVIAEIAPGARLSGDAARAAADAFLALQTRAPQHLVEARLQERPSRYDHVFTWEQDDLRVKDARIRRTIVIQGDRVGRYQEFLYVPEQWQRDFAGLRSKNELYTDIAQAFYVPLILAALGVIIHSVRKKRVPWRPLLLISGAVGVLMIVSQANNLPFFLDRLPTSARYEEALGIGLLFAVGAGVGVFFYIILAAAAGEPLYRGVRPSGLSLKNLPTARGIQSREFFRATVVGYGFAAAHIAYVVAFYLIGRRFGVWSPQDIEYSDLLSTSLPWIYPLTISLLAATSEEFWFRLFAVPLLKRWLRSTWIAVLIPAFIWGFLHANYPQQPGYIRGIEVGIIGVAAGFLMLRFGVASTLIWHYTVDAVFIGAYLLRSDSLYFRLSGVVVGGAVLVPFLISLVLYRLRGGFLVIEEPVAEPPAPVTTEELPPPGEPAIEPAAPRKTARWLYTAAVVAAAAALLVHPREYGEFIRLALTRVRSAQLADRALAARGIKPSDWRRTTEFGANLRVEEFEYLRRIQGARAAEATVGRRTQTGLWRTRYYKPLVKEEWHVWVRQDGGLERIDHLLDEKAPGPRLPVNDARARAAEYLRGTQNVEVERQRLVEANEEKRDNRSDHTFVWEDPAFAAGEARARVSVEMVGDEPSFYRRFLKLPEQWLREFRRPRLLGFLIPGVMGAIGTFLLVVVLRRLSRHVYHWRTYLIPTLAGVAITLISALNDWPVFWSGYSTETPPSDYAIQYVLGRLMMASLLGAGVFISMMALDVFRQLVSPPRALPSPSLARAMAMAVLLWGSGRLIDGLWEFVPGPRNSLPLNSFPGVNAALPGFTVLGHAILLAILYIGGIGATVYALAYFCKGRNRTAAVLTLAVLVAAGRALSVPQGLFLGLAVVAVFLLLKLAVDACGDDFVSYSVALFWLLAAEGGLRLARQPEPFFRANGVVAVAIALCLGLAVIRHYSKKGSPALR